MKMGDYIKEKRLMLSFLGAFLVFALLILWLDEGVLRANDHFRYLAKGALCFVIMILGADYVIFKRRIRRIEEFVYGDQPEEEASYPLDYRFYEKLKALVCELDEYKADIAEQSAEELDFITHWIHDVKVHIAAMRLILESETALSDDRLDMELIEIEQKIQKVLYHIKSNSFYEDFRIGEIGTAQLVHAALKPFAVFFSHKQMALNCRTDDYRVLTDEKWSVYILAQVISNAVKHTPIHGRIDIWTAQTEEGVFVHIKNEGKGISKNEIAHIFEKGYTSHEGRLQSAATGYGLYLAKKLADKLGHGFTCASVCGESVTFTLRFSAARMNLSKM